MSAKCITVYGLVGVFLILCVKKTLCDMYIMCTENHYSGVLDNTLQTWRKSLAWIFAFLEFGPGTSNFGHSCPTVKIVFTSRM